MYQMLISNLDVTKSNPCDKDRHLISLQSKMIL